MIVVKLMQTLKVSELGRLIPVGTVFREKNRKDLPKWLQAELQYFETTPKRATLLVKETLEKVAPIDSDAGKKDDAVVDDVKTEENDVPDKDPEPEPEKESEPEKENSPTLNKRNKK